MHEVALELLVWVRMQPGKRLLLVVALVLIGGRIWRRLPGLRRLRRGFGASLTILLMAVVGAVVHALAVDALTWNLVKQAVYTGVVAGVLAMERRDSHVHRR